MPSLEQINSTMYRMQTFRRFYDSNRLKFWKQYIGYKDAKLYPDNVTPRSAVPSMIPYSNVETIVSRVHDAYFTYEDWFEAKPRGTHDEQAADKMGQVLAYKLHRANLPGAFETFVRNIAIYGHAAIKVDWDFCYDVITKPQAIPLLNGFGQPLINPQTGQPVISKIIPTTVKVKRSRPTFTAIDVFDLFVDPDNRNIAVATDKTLGEILREFEMNPNLYDGNAIDKLAEKITQFEKDDPMGVLIRLAEYWDSTENTRAILTYAKDARENVSWKDQRYAVRTGSNLSTYRRKIYAGESIALWQGDNNFLHKRIPILHTSYVKVPGEVFGIGAIESIGTLTEGLDRFVNMITDNWNVNINSRVAYDTNADIDHEALNNVNVPGGKVGVNGKPSEVLFPLPHFVPSAGDYQIIELYKSMIESASGISDFYSKGVGSGGSNTTATGISSVIGESNYRFKQFIRNLELDVMQPLLEMCASMCQQFMEDPEEIEITGEPAGIKKLIWVTPEELLGTVDFDIVASNYASNKVIRQRNLMALAGLLAESPYINEGVAIRELLKTFEVKNIGALVKSDQQVMAEAQQQKSDQINMMILEAMLQTESKARVSQSRPQPSGGKEGRPAKAQFEGKIPGAGLSSSIRNFAQSMGANSLGLEGLGDHSNKP